MGFGMTMIANGDGNGEALWSTMDQMTLDGEFKKYSDLVKDSMNILHAATKRSIKRYYAAEQRVDELI